MKFGWIDLRARARRPLTPFAYFSYLQKSRHSRILSALLDPVDRRTHGGIWLHAWKSLFPMRKSKVRNEQGAAIPPARRNLYSPAPVHPARRSVNMNRAVKSLCSCAIVNSGFAQSGSYSFGMFGHALVALSVEHAAPVYRVSIIPRLVGALGHTLQLPTEERYLMTLPELDDQITVMMGGRAAEESVYKGVISTGAADDLQRASELIRQMVMRFGMSERLGHLTYGAPHNAQFLRFPFVSEERNYSEKTSEAIDAEVRRISDELYLRAKTILTRRRAELEAIALELMQKETLDRRQIDLLLPSPFKQIPA